MTSTFLKSLVSSIQTATTNYFSPKSNSKEQQQEKTFPETPTRDKTTTEMAPDSAVRKRIFKDVVYYDASSCLDDTHRSALQSGGAVENVPDGYEIEWENITHVFTNNMDFPGKQEASKQERLSIMTPRWIEITSRRSVLQNPNNFSPDPKMFFSGLVVTCAELPAGDREAIFGGFVANGGMYDDVLRTTTTHVIALNIDNEKCRRALKEENLRIKIVLPHWFDDCLKLRRLVDEKPYLLPDAPLFKALSAQNNGLNPADPVPSDHLAYTHFGSIQNQSSPPPSTTTIFKGNRKKVLLGKDIGVSERLRGTLETVIRRAGGKLVESVSDAQVYIGAWREKEDYILASRKGAVVGNLTWLYYMLANDRYISPRCHLLHYPLVRGGMSEMKNMIMTVTNYQGEARAYLEKLVEACGAKFTRNMTTSNTHLIAASKAGDKCKHAHDWGIDVVNHLWLEETYAKWQVQSVTIPRYTHFPPQTNLTEIVDKTEIQEEGIADFFIPRDDEDEDMMDANLISGTTANEPRGAHVQSSYVEKKTPAPKAAPKVAGTKGSGPETPVTESVPESLRTATPGSNKRKAAENAMNKLHNEIMPDVIAWQKEKNRKRIPEEPQTAEELDKKRKMEKRKSEEKENIEATAKKPRKDADTVVENASRITLLITGAPDDLTSPNAIKKLSRMGIRLMSEGGHCTHLAAPHILRTEKFLCALAYAPIVVSLKWVQDCLEKDTVLDPKLYPLRDRENEKKYRFTLDQSVTRARENHRQLFKNHQVYISSALPSHTALLRIVEANGGEARVVSNAIKGRAKVLRTDYVRAVGQILICSTTAEDKGLRSKFQEEVSEGTLTSGIYTAEWIMRSVLRQKIAEEADILISS